MGATRVGIICTLAAACVAATATPAVAGPGAQIETTSFRAPAAAGTDRVIVGFRRPERVDAAQAIGEAGGRVVDRSSSSGFFVVETGADAQAWADALEDDEAVRYAEPDWKLSAADLSRTDPLAKDLWGVRRIGASAASTVTASAPGAEIVVAVIDSGIDYTHEDLAAEMWVNPGEDPATPGDDDGNGWSNDVHGIDCANEDADPMDDNGHGTHVAGTIAATRGNGEGVMGVAPNVKIMALKFLGADGTGYTSDAIQCLDYAVANGALITNNSWGGPTFSQPLQDAIERAGAENQLFVAAAGNEGTSNETQPHYPASYELANVVSVAATDREDRLAGFSNHGSTSVDLAAPGVSILSTVPGGYASYSGTSMATPHVAGAAALLSGTDPALLADVSALRAAVLQQVEPLPALQGRVRTGGRLDLAWSAGSTPSASAPSASTTCKRRTGRGCRRPG